VEDVERLMIETGTTRAEAFRVYNNHFNTFDSYKAFKQFRHRHRYRALPRDPLNREIQTLFRETPADDIGSLYRSTRRDMTELDREEHRATVLALRNSIEADPKFLDRLLDDYARMILRSNG
jgi:hypothetical protein